jgi:diadenosine tetraphosphate (Ap4A) HIT family hydrolase
MENFTLHPQLQADSFLVGNLALSQLLMMNDNQYPWFVLVPRRHDVSEIYQLDTEDRSLLMAESCMLAEALQNIYSPDKLNIAAIGNLVPQLHIHHVVRYRTDKAWPAPIWGQYPPVAMTAEQAESLMSEIKMSMSVYFLH